MTIRRLCVFCGAAEGDAPIFKAQAVELGHRLAAEGIELVFGGGHVGLMGILADAVLRAGGKAIGVIPQDLVDKELAHKGVAELKIVPTMPKRKAVMAELADGFIAMPGGFGTLEEFCEVLTLSMLGYEKKPCALLNLDGYYDHLIQFFDTAVKFKFVNEEHRGLVLVSNSVDDLLTQIKNFKYDVIPRWEVGEKR